MLSQLESTPSQPTHATSPFFRPQPESSFVDKPHTIPDISTVDTDTQTSEWTDPRLIEELAEKDDRLSHREQLLTEKDEEISALQEELDSISHTVSSLKQGMNIDSSKHGSEVQSLLEENRKAHEEINRLKDLIGKKDGEMAREMQTKTDVILQRESELADMKTKLSQSESSISNLESDLSRARGENQSLSNGLKQLDQELSLSEKKVDVLQNQLSESMQQRSKISEDLNNSRLKIRELEGEIQILSMNFRHLKAENMHLMSLSSGGMGGYPRAMNNQMPKMESTYEPQPYTPPAVPTQPPQSNSQSQSHHHAPQSNPPASESKHDYQTYQSQSSTKSQSTPSYKPPAHNQFTDQADRTYQQLMVLHSSIPDDDPNKPPPPMSFDEFLKSKGKGKSKQMTKPQVRKSLKTEETVRPFADDSDSIIQTSSSLEEKLRSMQMEVDEKVGMLNRLDSMALKRVEKMRKSRQLEGELESLRAEINRVKLQLRKIGHV
ncbi:hypothetical protein GEMRC1_005164 [Eukaryota sp. GEM-RC1]